MLALKDAVEHVIEHIAKTLEELKKDLIQIKNSVNNIGKILNSSSLRLVKDIYIFFLVHTFQKVFKWLANIVNVCNNKLGTPFKRCSRVVDDTIEECRKQLGIAHSLCDVTNLLKTFCNSVKFIDYLCELIDFISDSVLVEMKLSKINS